MNRITVDMSPLVHGSGAVSRCTECMARELLEYEDAGFDFLYFDYKRQTERYLKPSKDNVNEIVIRMPQRLLIPFWKRFSWPNLEMLLPECNLFYTNEFYFPPSNNVLVLATIHGLAYRVIPEKISSQIVQSLDQGLSFILKHADYLVAVSEATKRELICNVGVRPERIYVVTHGVDKQFHYEEDEEQVWGRLRKLYGFSRPYILYVGAIGRHKNISGILRAYERLSSKLSHDLVLVGRADSAWAEAHQFVSDHNLSERVQFLGYVDQKGTNLLDLYNGADLFVFPSFYEGWSSPPLEAMACGTPFITSNCSSLPETVGNAAIQVDPCNSEALAYQMERVLSDKTLKKQLVTMGFDHVSSHSWHKAAKRLIDAFADAWSRGPWREENNEGCD